ncbi:tRNA (cytidine(34)-2'-O)-methyltransferase [Prochlorococcus marinus]|uniref:tRNA (cytidine(34)-2'-O)-methyltransferase n=1 Tax=Prochlorococcus marinus TaxID=1219 RepID=UPI0022B351D5|nr:tRNA (cytidine(34)-2'-O)-methyltransferase [Prochlorococcus marinus]
MIHNIRIGLFEPRIPQNTGNIGRTCLAFNFPLDLIYPLGFSLDNSYLKRAGLDYWKNVNLTTHKNFTNYQEYVKNSRIIAFSKDGDINLDSLIFKKDDCLLFGREDNGLPNSVKSKCNLVATIQMPSKYHSIRNKSGVRSLNLSVACGIAAYYAMRSCS